jgi:6-phosphogluconolactonase
MPDVRVCEDIDDLSRRAAEAIAEVIGHVVSAKGRCSLALAGGNTPRRLYRELASRFGQAIAWDRVHVFWGDERFVPAGDPERNELMARLTLLDHVPCPLSNVHPIAAPPDVIDAAAAARTCEAAMRLHFAAEWPRFDLVLLGLGADGHTASLFPHSPALREDGRWATTSTSPLPPVERVTLTFPVFNRAAAVYFLVSGADKAPALQRVFVGTDVRSCPAAGIHTADGAVTWWVDRPAAGQ